MPRNPRPKIEPATSADVDAVLECWLRLADEQRAHGSSIRVETNREAIRQMLAAHQVAGGLLIARLDGDIVGFATVTIETGTFDLDVTRGLLSNLWVAPAHRNRGIGHELLEAAEETLRERGADVCRLEVMDDNEDARQFYRDHGFESRRRIMDHPLTDCDRNDTPSKDDG